MFHRQFLAEYDLVDIVELPVSLLTAIISRQWPEQHDIKKSYKEENEDKLEGWKFTGTTSLTAQIHNFELNRK